LLIDSGIESPKIESRMNVKVHPAFLMGQVISA